MGTQTYKDFLAGRKTKVNVYIPVKMREMMEKEHISPSDCTIKGFQHVIDREPLIKILNQKIGQLQKAITRYDERLTSVNRENLVLRSKIENYKEKTDVRIRAIEILAQKIPDQEKNVDKILREALKL